MSESGFARWKDDMILKNGKNRMKHYPSKNKYSITRNPENRLIWLIIFQTITCKTEGKEH
jgi:hypothetical protein